MSLPSRRRFYSRWTRPNQYLANTRFPKYSLKLPDSDGCISKFFSIFFSSKFFNSYLHFSVLFSVFSGWARAGSMWSPVGSCSRWGFLGDACVIKRVNSPRGFYSRMCLRTAARDFVRPSTLGGFTARRRYTIFSTKSRVHLEKWSMIWKNKKIIIVFYAKRELLLDFSKNSIDRSYEKSSQVILKLIRMW